MTSIQFNDSSNNTLNYKFSGVEFKSRFDQDLSLVSLNGLTSCKVGNSYFQVPLGTTAERPSAIDINNGAFRFNTTDSVFEYYVGGSWVEIVAPPAISSISPLVFDLSAQPGGAAAVVLDNSINIFGSGFGTGATVNFVDTGGGTTLSPTIYVNTDSYIRAEVPQSIVDVSDVEPYQVRVTNNISGLSVSSQNPYIFELNDVPYFTNPVFPGGFYADLSFSDAQIASGTTTYTLNGELDLFAADDGDYFPIDFSSSDLKDIPTVGANVFTLTTKDLPGQDISFGEITGTFTVPSSTTNYSFNATVTDAILASSSRLFLFKFTKRVDVSYNIGTLTTSDYTVTYADTLTGTGNTQSSGPYTNGTGSTIIAFRDPLTTAPGSTKTGNITFTNIGGVNISVEYLVVAGGGCTYSIAGSSGGVGGGGAGGMRTGTLSLVNATPYTVSVGAGAPANTTPVTRGVNSTFATISSTGGGSSEQTSYDAAIQDGGSGAGEGYGSNNPQYDNNGPGNAGGYSPPEGNAGGNGGGDGGAGTGIGGGGGGAGQAGDTNGVGHGGDGAQSSITGQAVYYAGGGGSQFDGPGGDSTTVQPGGLGGGGDGATSNSSPLNAQAGENGKGGGGGGMWDSYDDQGAAGGSGIIVIRFPSFIDLP